MKLFGRSNFIEIYDRALSPAQCETLISGFENFPNKKEGRVESDNNKKLDYDIKKCSQISGDLNNFSDKVTHIIRPSLFSCLKKYDEKYESLRYLSSWSYYSSFNIQKYDGEDDGYKAWHCEHGSSEDSSLRILAWMFYLNDAKSGTEFMNFPTVQGKTGRCIIWPAGWTHIHKGVIPNKGLKYIVTGWVSLVPERS